MTYDELKEQGFDAAQIPESSWEVYRVDPDGVWREDIHWIERPRGDFGGISIKRKVNLHEDALLEANRREYEDDKTMIRNNGTSLDAKVASIPLNIYFAELNEHVKNGDKEHIKWWLNQEKNRPYRTQKGKL